MNFKHISVCAGLIASSVLAFSTTPVQAAVPIEQIVGFNFSSNDNLGTCNKILLGSSCVTEGIETSSGFTIKSIGGNLKKSNFLGFVGLGVDGDGDDDMFDPFFLNGGEESIILTLPTLSFPLPGGGKIVKDFSLTELSFNTVVNSILIEGFDINGIKIGKKIGKRGENLFNRNNLFLGSDNAKKFQLTVPKGFSKLVSARATATISSETVVPVPEPTPTVGLFGVLAGLLAYKGMTRLAKRDQLDLSK